MKPQKIKTLGQLKAAGYISRSIKDELRANLIHNLLNGLPSFEGIHGYENTVIPELERAILSRHHINLLGLRGQAKTRLARMMTQLLDPWVPIIDGSEINDDPLKPLSRYALDRIAALQDDTPIAWLDRDSRFSEKLATPDVTVADLIGDIDPIKAANLKLSYADDRVIHYGMIPRANRCIFVINELPDLQARIQVALFNILQEGDIQIRGFKLRLPLDMQFIFTANPEDYTNRGSIVTPLKDRIGSQILTHYPTDRATAMKITHQEAHPNTVQQQSIHVPALAKELLEQLSFEARNSEYIDPKSGISARLSISAYENLLSTTEHRMLQTSHSKLTKNGHSKKQKSTVRLADFLGVVPSITGKVELVYEGEQEGGAQVAQELINHAVASLFMEYFPKIEKLEKAETPSPYQAVVDWFFESDGFELLDTLDQQTYQEKLDSIPPLEALIDHYQRDTPDADRYFLKEFVLWALVANDKLSKYRLLEGFRFKDRYGSYVSGL